MIKRFYTVGAAHAGKWVREAVKGLPQLDAPQFSSGLSCGLDRAKRFCVGAVFNLNNHTNMMMNSGRNTFTTSAATVCNANVPVLPVNFRRVVALYAARKLVTGNWINDKDEYLVPTAKEF